jgi:hypothetical protein
MNVTVEEKNRLMRHNIAILHTLCVSGNTFATKKTTKKGRTQTRKH